MNNKRILTIQDVSCVGQCSLTVALPILSACGLETAVLPSAVLSTHTGGFTGYTFRDLTDDMPAIEAHWKKENIRFDAVYTGYLGSIRQIGCVASIMDSCLAENGTLIVDPAMADNGKLYPGFDEEFAGAMKQLCKKADYLLPNVTEACLLTGTEYRAELDRDYIDRLLAALRAEFPGTIVLTGVGFGPDRTGVLVASPGETLHYEHRRLEKGCHGTGDIFASAFTGAFLRGFTPYRAAEIAADYVVSCIEETAADPDHWYGARFEPVLHELAEAVRSASRS